MKRTQWMAISLAALMGISAAGCGSESGSSTADSTAADTSTATETTSTTETTTAAEPAVDDEGFTNAITLDSEGEVNVFAFSEGQNYQKVIDKFEEVTKDTLKTNLNFQFATSIKEEAPLKLAAKEDVDLIFDATWVNSQKNINDGMYLDLTKYFNNPDYPGLQKAFPEEVLDAMRFTDGKIYGIPYYTNYNSMPCIYIRGDWRKKYNLPEVTDEDTLYQYLETINEHADELGITSAVGLSSRGWFYFKSQPKDWADQGIYEVTGTGARVTQNMYVQLNDDATEVIDARMIGEDDSNFADWNITTNFLNEKAIELGNKWYQFVNKDAISLDSAEAGFESGLYGAFENELTAYSTVESNLKSYDPNAELEYYIYFDQIRNKETYMRGDTISSNFMYVPYYCDDPDRAMAVVDWVFESQANNDLWTLGIEGEDWEAVGDDQYRDLQPENKYSFPTWLWSQNPSYTRMNADLPEDVVSYYEYAADESNFSAHPFSGFSFDNTEVSMEYTALTTLQEDYYHQFMIGEFGADTEAKLQEFNEQASGYEDTIRAELISQLQAYLDNKNAQ